MSDSIDRFKKRKAFLKCNQSKPFVPGLVDQALVDQLLSRGADSNLIATLDYSTDTTVNVGVTASEVEMLLSELKSSFHAERLDQLLSETKRGIISSVAGPFGIGKLISAYDKVGGNVTTVNNANNGVYASTEDKYVRTDYTHTKNSNGEQFAGAGKRSVGAKFVREKMNENKMVVDVYTGANVLASTTSPDHGYSLSQYHKNGGFMQTDTQKADFATDTDNLGMTDRLINQSMRDFDKEKWANKTNNEGIKNKERYGIDEEMLKEQVAKGRAAAEKHLPTDLEKTEYYLANSTLTGFGEGAKMGAQQALGFLLVEFLSSAIVEIKDAYKGKKTGDSLYNEIKIRLLRIGQKVADKWKEAFAGFASGFISGFISNLVTTLINLFVTTGKRLVRMIREGIFSLLKALKLILFPPAEMNYTEAMHEGMKLICAGGIIIAGVALEELIEKLFLGTPILAPFASIATPVIVGALTAIAMSLVAYLIDRMDILGAIKAQESKFIHAHLDARIEEQLLQCESISEELDQYINTPVALLA